MNIYDAILRDYPVAAYKFGPASATSFSNLMGGNPAFSAPQNSGVNAAIYPGQMVSGDSHALVLGNGWFGTVPFDNRFTKNFNGLPFSIEMVVKLDDVGTAGSTLLATHASSTDGLFFDGDYISFGVDLDGGGSVVAKWPVPDFSQNYHIVGTYNASRVILYVDGTKVASEEIPEGSLLATKSAQTLYIGYAPSRTVLVEAPAIYNIDLTATQILSHYLASRQNIPTDDAVAAYGGRLFKFTDNERDVLFKDSVIWTQEGITDDVDAGEYLRPVYGDDDLSVVGTYTYAIQSGDLLSTEDSQGIKLEWNGDGDFVVEYSIDDGSTWLAAVNGGVQVSTIGLSVQNQPLVRITFSAGRAKDLDVVRDLTATVYSSLEVRAVNDAERNIIFSSATNSTTSSNWSEPIEMDDGTGTKLFGNAATLQESVEVDLTNIGTVEMWVQWGGTNGSYFFDSRSVTPSNPAYLWVSTSGTLGFPAALSAVYVNGVAVTANTFTPVAGRWYHVVCVWATPHNAKISFTAGVGTYHMNMMAHYEAQLTSSQVSALYSSYFGAPKLSLQEVGGVVVSETSPSAKVYVNDWSIQGAG